MSNEIFICKICGKELKTMHHLQKHKITAKDYYDKYIKTENEGKCLNCGNDTKYISLLQGYRHFCCCRCNVEYNELGAKFGEENVSKRKEVRLKISKAIKNRISDSIEYKNKLLSNINEEKVKLKRKIHMTETKNSVEYKTKCAEKITNKYEKQGLKLRIIETNNEYKRCECLECNSIFTIKNNLFYVRKRLGEKICLNCNPVIKNFSRKEKTLSNYIKEIYKGKIIENDTNELNGKELDIWLPEKRIAFEFDGSYWHRDERCFEKQLKNELFRNETNKIHERDRLKDDLCKCKNIKLIRIKEYDWDNDRQTMLIYIKEIIYD